MLGTKYSEKEFKMSLVSLKMCSINLWVKIMFCIGRMTFNASPSQMTYLHPKSTAVVVHSIATLVHSIGNLASDLRGTSLLWFLLML